MSPIDLSLQILQANTFCMLGTASAAATPWVTPVAYRIDDQLNFYWTSDVNTKHSQLLLENPQMSLCVLDQAGVTDIHYPDGKSHPRALYVAGEGREIPYSELPELLHWRYAHNQKSVADFDPTIQPNRIYQCNTKAFWYLADPQSQPTMPTDQRIELSLGELGAAYVAKA